MDSHSVFADPDPAVFLNADPDLALKLRKNLPYEEFAVVEKTKKDGSKVKNYGAGPYLLIKKKKLPTPIFISVIFKFFLTGSGSRWENECGSRSTVLVVIESILSMALE